MSLRGVLSADNARRVAVAMAALLYALACPPYQWSPAAWLVPGLLLTAMVGVRPRRAFVHGILFALLFGYGMTSWAIGASLEYFEFGRPAAWLFATGVWLACGFPYALLCAAYAWCSKFMPIAARAPLAAWLWVAAELVRTTALSGMPWELLGHTQFEVLWLIQLADLGGVYAVSFIMVLVSVGFSEMVRAAVQSEAIDLRSPALALSALAAVVVYGQVSLARASDDASNATTSVAVVQGNVPNAMRWEQSHFEEALAVYTQLSREVASLEPDLVVWPENAVSFYVEREPRLRRELQRSAKIGRAGLIFGAPRFDEQAGVARNSAYWLAGSGDILGVYDKQKLVPFAEYDPLAGKVSGDELVYRAGAKAALLDAGGERIGAVICYEIIFPGLVRELVTKGARLLVNLSNDSWMDVGDGVAPRQHLSMAVFRAVETRRYLVRASAGGYSGFVSPRGRVYSALPNHSAATSVGNVAFRDDITPYVRWGDGWAFFGIAGSFASIARSRRRA